MSPCLSHLHYFGRIAYYTVLVIFDNQSTNELRYIHACLLGNEIYHVIQNKRYGTRRV